ncbi:MAG: hypothetical protein GDA49_09840 [Rhodospirillales bacterium]|nr:hypothetical protein [Rhodospirillales bacterium]
MEPDRAAQVETMETLLPGLQPSRSTVPIWCSPLEHKRQSCAIVCAALGRDTKAVRYGERLMEVSNGAW